MPELAEVEYYRTRWNCGLNQTITAIKVHGTKRLFRTVAVEQLCQRLPGTVLIGSEARGKQLLIQFSEDLWLGLHLGMTGKLRSDSPGLQPGKHDHLVIYQSAQALVFSDPRLFGLVQFHSGPSEPDWWARLPPAVNSPAFSRARMEAFLARHGKLPIKAALLLQAGFPGVGNWMADEILWRAKISPLLAAGDLSSQQQTALWRSLRFVCRAALRHIGKDFSDPPSGWLFHERWTAAGQCPEHGTDLARQQVGGRTTAWCRTCQS